MMSADSPELVLQDGQAIDEQILEQIRGHVLAGRLRPGEQLPTLRALAVGLAVSPELVWRALQSLEHEGLLTTAEGSGIFVTGPSQPAEPVRQADLEQSCVEFLSHVTRRGFTSSEALATLSAILES